ncbi:MAG: putative chromosome-partitioning protein ParB [Syntrophaceae bacterium PtaU1.Bin231]|nr:MAG: putative chromosome-partitioning protein ParB [Syntrophaceae bacterium PtaU1.Bin231]
MNLIKVKTDSVFPNQYNPNLMSGKEFDRLKYSIEKFGQVVPILVRPVNAGNGVQYEIVDGEHRWRALKELGVEECFCVEYASEADLDEYKMVSVAINEIHGSIDNKLLRGIFDINNAMVAEFLGKLDMLRSFNVQSTEGETEQLTSTFANVGVEDWEGLSAWEEDKDFESFTVLSTAGEVSALRGLMKMFDGWNMKLLKGIVENVSQRELDDDERFFLLWQLATRRAFLHKGLAHKAKPKEVMSIVIRGQKADLAAILTAAKAMDRGQLMQEIGG